MTTFQSVFLVLVAALLAGSLIRLVRTPTENPLRQERADMVCLLALLLLGQGGVLARGRFMAGETVVNNLGYWLCNALLLPVSLSALFYIRRLYRAYRNAPLSPSTRVTKPTARVLSPPRIEPSSSKDRNRRT